MQNITDENTKIENNLVLPVLAVRGLVFFPGMMLQFDVARKKSMLGCVGGPFQGPADFPGDPDRPFGEGAHGARTCTKSASLPGSPRWCTTPRRV